MNMNSYLFYLVYVVAVAACSVLLLRRQNKSPNRLEPPQELEIALLRGGLGAVVETVIFDLQLRNIIELNVDSRSKQVVASLNRENVHALSPLEHDSLKAFEKIQAQEQAIKKTRQSMSDSIAEIETAMQTAGWWKRPARWKWVMTILSLGLIVFGSLRFIHSYEGGLQLALALTVPVLAVLMRRLIIHEMSGPTGRGRMLLKRFQEEKTDNPDALWQVALHGTQRLKDVPQYRLYCFMMRGIPFGKL
jgi:uncharacterized protein (TIGR04222 family)